jgi:hypothetical protein
MEVCQKRLFKGEIGWETDEFLLPPSFGIKITHWMPLPDPPEDS